MPGNPVRIFISSPADVRPERLRAEQIVRRLDSEFAYHFRIEAVLWERRPLVATRHFQDEENIPAPRSTDIVVVILWSRLGALLPADRFHGAISCRAVTGTEWEFEDALAAARQNGVPDLLLYRKLAPAVADLNDRKAVDEQLAQLDLVEEFVGRWLHTDGGNSWTAAWHGFNTATEFEEQLYDHLRGLLERRAGATTQGGMEIRWHEAPFRGLLPFEFEHAGVFFGRTAARNELRELLARRESAGSSFVLVLGASGSGKSSLVKAGLLPDLTLPGMIGRVALVRHALLHPSDRPDELTRGLAEAILSPTALPELAGHGYTADRLAALLRQAPEHAVVPIEQGLAAAAKAAHLAESAEARLTLIVDQLEELFTFERIDQSARETFVRSLQALARSGSVWAVATMRSDFYHRLESLSALSQLASEEACYRIVPPNDAELGQIIRQPAREAGLTFEIDSRRGIALDEIIREAAARDRNSMPLLSFLLDQLWQRRTGKRLLTFAAYEVLGGLEGALGQRAEEVFGAQPPEVQAALPRVLRALVTVGTTAEDAVTARQALFSQFSDGSVEQRLIATFLSPDARLLVADEGDGGGPRIRVAHEALLTHWPRARDLIARDREGLRVRAAVEAVEAAWCAADATSRRANLLRDPLLANAKDLDRRWGDELASELRQFIAGSVAAARAAIRRRWIVAAIVMLILAGLAVASIGALTIAEQQRNDALIAQSRFLARDAQAATDHGDATLGQLLALEALPRNLAHADRPFVIDAEAALFNAMANRHERVALLGHEGSIRAGAFSPDGKILATASDDHSVRLWNAATGTTAGVLQGHAAEVNALAFSPDGKRVATGSNDRTARLWSAETGAQLAVMAGHERSVLCVAFSTDGRRVATASDDNTVRLWDAASGMTVGTLSGHEDAVRMAQFSTDGTQLLTASDDGTARLWDVETGAPLAVLRGHEAVVNSAVFSSDSKAIVTASNDTTARIWDATTGAERAVLRGHQDEVYAAVFSPDGKSVATASKDRAARLWDAGTGANLAILHHDDAVLSAAFSTDGKLLLTASLDQTARLWDSSTGVAVATLRGHKGPVLAAAFSRDGKLVATMSDDQSARVWNVSPTIAYAALNHEAPVIAASFSPDGKSLLTGSLDGTARLWETTSGAPLAAFRGHEGGVNAASFSADGRRVLTTSVDGTARLWDAVTGAALLTFEGKVAGVGSAAISPDGRRVATSAGAMVQLWDAETGMQRVAIRGHKNLIETVSFSAHGRRIVTASADGTAQIWDTDSGANLAVLRGHDSWLTLAKFSPDGRQIVTASGDATARLWDAQTGDPLSVLSGHQGAVWAAAFSPDGKTVVTASRDQTARVWDVATGALLAILSGHQAALSSVVFSADGRYLLTASQDNTARLWDAATGTSLGILRGHGGSVLSAVFSPDGVRLATASGDYRALLWLLPPHCQALIDASRVIVPRALSQGERHEYFVEQRASGRFMSFYATVRPALAWVLPAARNRCAPL